MTGKAWQAPSLPGRPAGCRPRGELQFPSRVLAHPLLSQGGQSGFKLRPLANCVRPTHIMEGVCVCARSVIQSSLTCCNPRGLQPTRLLCPRDFPDENAGVGCCFLLQGIFPTQGSNPCLLRPLPWQADLHLCATWESQWRVICFKFTHLMLISSKKYLHKNICKEISGYHDLAKLTHKTNSFRFICKP